MLYKLKPGLSINNNILTTELLQMAANDEEAFKTIYANYWQELFVLAAKMLRSEEEAADVVQDVFLSFWRRRKELVIQGSLAAYLHSSVRYKVRDYIAKNITQRDYLALFTDTAIHTLPPQSEIRLQLKEVQQTIQQTVLKMPERMQQAYRLHREEHLSYQEIAGKMGIAPETVRKQVQNALALIKTALNYNDVAFIILLSYLVK